MAKVKASTIKKNDKIIVGHTTFIVSKVKSSGSKIVIHGPGLIHRVDPDTLVERA